MSPRDGVQKKRPSVVNRRQLDQRRMLVSGHQQEESREKVSRPRSGIIKWNWAKWIRHRDDRVNKMTKPMVKNETDLDIRLSYVDDFQK